MKVLYIGTTASIIYTIKFQEPIKSTYDKAQDTFLHWKFAAAPCLFLAVITHLIGAGFAAFDIMELLWTFSIYLESIAILPQLIVLQRYREVENLTGNYIFFMGAYRALYILNWIYRAHTEPHYKHHWVVYFCGVLQTLLYADFFYYYVKRWVFLFGRCWCWDCNIPFANHFCFLQQVKRGAFHFAHSWQCIGA
jgi:ER lumen protein retaining receptor